MAVLAVGGVPLGDVIRFGASVVIERQVTIDAGVWGPRIGARWMTIAAAHQPVLTAQRKLHMAEYGGNKADLGMAAVTGAELGAVNGIADFGAVFQVAVLAVGGQPLIDAKTVAAAAVCGAVGAPERKGGEHMAKARWPPMPLVVALAAVGPKSVVVGVVFPVAELAVFAQPLEVDILAMAVGAGQGVVHPFEPKVACVVHLAPDVVKGPRVVAALTIPAKLSRMPITVALVTLLSHDGKCQVLFRRHALGPPRLWRTGGRWWTVAVTAGNFWVSTCQGKCAVGKKWSALFGTVALLALGAKFALVRLVF